MGKQHKIRWQEADKKELAKAVKNFNAKISRLEKKIDPKLKNALPERVTMKKVKELIYTRKDLERELDSLHRFTDRGSEQLVTIPDNDYNLQITKWQKDDMKRRKAIINRRRNKKAKEIAEIEMTSRGEKLGYKRGQIGMRKIDENALKPINAFTPKMTRTSLKRKYDVLKNEARDVYWKESDDIMKERFINSILENYNPNDVQDVVKEIENMNFKEFYKIYHAEGGTFDPNYPPNALEYQKYLTTLKATWLPVKAPKGLGVSGGPLKKK